MAKNEQSSSYQSLGNGVYRVGGAVTRNAVTGRYITSKATASHSHRATVAERSSGSTKGTSKRG